MSSFNCPKCGEAIIDQLGGDYITGCEHYPLREINNCQDARCAAAGECKCIPLKNKCTDKTTACYDRNCVYCYPFMTMEDLKKSGEFPVCPDKFKKVVSSKMEQANALDGALNETLWKKEFKKFEEEHKKTTDRILKSRQNTSSGCSRCGFIGKGQHTCLHGKPELGQPLEKVEEVKKPDSWEKRVDNMHIVKHISGEWIFTWGDDEEDEYSFLTEFIQSLRTKSYSEGRRAGIEEAIQKINQLDTREPHTHSYVVCEACGEQRGQISARNVCEELLNKKPNETN